MNRMFLLTALVAANAYAKAPEVIVRPTFADSCRRVLLYPPLVKSENAEVSAEIQVDGHITAQAQATLSSDGLSLLKPAFYYYQDVAENLGLVNKLLEKNPQVIEVELTLAGDDLKAFKGAAGGTRAKIRATPIYQKLAALGYKNIIVESVGDDDVQVTLSKKGYLWRVLRY